MKTGIRSIFLIEIIDLDSMENGLFGAVKYRPFGFVNTEEEAEQFCKKGRIFTRKDCWAIWDELKEYRYSKVKYCG